MGKKSKTKETIEQAGKPISSDSEMNGLTFSLIGVLSLSLTLCHMPYIICLWQRLTLALLLSNAGAPVAIVFSL